MKKQFTLIELLVVIAIIAILAAILMPALSSARERGKQSTCISNMKTLGSALTSYADDQVTYPWPAVVGTWNMPGETGAKYNTTWCLLTGYRAGTVKYGTSYIEPFTNGKTKAGKQPQMQCPSHDGQTNGAGSKVAHYMFIGSSSWQVSGGSYGVTGASEAAIQYDRKYSTAPSMVKAPATKIMMVERKLGDFALSSPSYIVPTRSSLPGGGNSTKLGPVHSGKASAVHYDGHVSMLDMESEFYMSDDSRGTAIFRQYFNNRKVY